MPIARIRVTAISDEGDTVVVWGRPEYLEEESAPVGYAFQTKGESADAVLAARASRLTSGMECVIEFTPVAAGWALARGLTTS